MLDRRAHLDRDLVSIRQERDGADLVVFGYANQTGEEPPAGFLPDGKTIRRLAALGVVRGDSGGGPDQIWWAVNRSMRSRRKGEPGRAVFRLSYEGGADSWVAVEEAGETALRSGGELWVACIWGG